MDNEAWLSGKMAGFAPVIMPAAHALEQAIKDLKQVALNLNDRELLMHPNNAPSVAFHLRHIAGSIDRLLTYARNQQLSDTQFVELAAETTAANSAETIAQLTQKAINKVNEALDVLQNVSLEELFEERFVGRQKLPTNVFGLLFHIAEHTARHIGQIVTTAKIVKGPADPKL